MSAASNDPIVAFAQDPEWLNAQAQMFGLDPPSRFIPCEREETALETIGSLPCSALLIDARISAPVAFAGRVRRIQPKLPILFIASQPYEEGEQFDKGHGFAAVVLDRLDPADLLGLDEVRAFKRKILLTRDAILARTKASRPPRHVFVELSIRSSELGFSVKSEVDVLVPERTIQWTGREKLRKDADLYRNWTLMREHEGLHKRLVDDWQLHLDGVGDRILNEVFPPDYLQMLEQWAGRLADAQERIHYRFQVQDKDLMHLPFELMRHPRHERRLREVSPVSRQIALDSLDRFRSYSSSAGRPPKVLCIVSNVRGTLAIRGFKFADKSSRWFSPLDALELECQEVVKAYEDKHAPLHLEPGDTVKQLKARLAEGWDIVHFCGHSVRANAARNSPQPEKRCVFLVLPGRTAGGPLNWVSMSEFARYVRDAGAQMVVLSSCESSSVEALADLASAGLPIGVGFRWEVEDSSAKEFSKGLHAELAGGEPICRAFLRTLRSLLEPRPDRSNHEPAVVATMLVVQGDFWTSCASPAAGPTYHAPA